MAHDIAVVGNPRVLGMELMVTLDLLRRDRPGAGSTSPRPGGWRATGGRSTPSSPPSAGSRNAPDASCLCTGAFILGAAGLLDGKRATTHWMYGDLLAARHPDVHVDTDPIFIADAGTWTSIAGPWSAPSPIST